MAHSNYAKDRDLMQEAYSSVKGTIPPTQSTAPARMLNEAHCDEEHLPAEDGSCTSHEDNEGALKNEVLAAIKAKAAEYGGNKGAMAHAAQELAAEYEQAGETEKASIAKNQGAVFATFRENEEGEGAEDKFPDGEGKYEVAAVGGMHGQSIMGGKKFNSLQAACDAAGADIKDCYEDVDGWIDMEGDGTTLEFMVDEDTAIVMHKNVSTEDAEGESGFNSKQKEELEDIVHSILDKRDSEERAAEHYR